MSNITKKIAIIDAKSVQAGRLLEMLANLNSYKNKAIDIFPVVMKEQVGSEVSFGDQILATKTLEEFISSQEKVDVLYTFCNPRITEKRTKDFETCCQQWVDFSGAVFQDEKSIVAGKNNKNEWLKAKKVLIPDAGTLMLDHLLSVFSKGEYIVERLNGFLMESASTHGKEWMDELFGQTRSSFMNQPPAVRCYHKRISFNVLPVHGDRHSDGQNEKEWRIRSELQKIHGHNLKLALDCVQVPVFVGNSLSVHVIFEKPVTAQIMRSFLRKQKGVVVMDDNKRDTFSTPIDTVGDESLLVGRIREDWSHETALHFWLCADNLTLRCLPAMAVLES